MVDQANDTKQKAEKMQREFDKLSRENSSEMKGALSKAVDVTEAKDGKTYWLWMEVDPKIGSMIRAAQQWITPKLNDFGAPKVGKLFETAARSLKADQATAKAANTIGQSAFLWSTVFFQQIADLASYSADYTKRRNELYKQFKPIIEAAGVSVGANEVMQTEYQRASGQFTSSVKSMAGDLVTLVPNVMIAAQHQNRLLDKQPFTFSFGKKTEEAPVKTEAQLAAEHRELVQKKIKERLDLLEGSGYVDDAYKRQIAQEVAREHSSVKPEVVVKSDEKSMTDLLTAASIASPIINSLVKEKEEKSVTAWQMIVKLKSEVDAVCSRKGGDCEFSLPDTSRIRVDGKGLADYIVAIFQQNEINRGRTEIAGVNLERLHESAEQIADALAKGLIDTNALVVLVGEHKVISRKGAEVRVVSDEELKTNLDKIAEHLGKKSELSADEFFKGFTNKEAIAKEIKDNLASMKGLERACFAALLPDEVLKQAGESEKSIHDARVQASEHMYAIVDTYMHKLAEAVENSTSEELHQMGLTRKNVKSLQRLVEAMDSGDKKEALNAVIKGHHKEMMAMMASVMLNQQRDDQAGMRSDWAKLVSPPKEVAKPVVAAEEEHKPIGSSRVQQAEEGTSYAIAPEAMKKSTERKVDDAPDEEVSHASRVSKAAAVTPRDRLARAESSPNIGIGGV